MSDVPIKDYVDAINAERRHTGNMRTLAVCGTFGALIFGIFQAVGVYAKTNREYFALHNDLIRKGERDHAAIKAEMVTKAEFEPVKAAADRAQGGQTSATKLIGYMIAGTTLALGAVVAWANGRIG